MKILLLGSNGMLGKAIQKAASEFSAWELVTVARSNADWCIDLTNDEEVKRCINTTKPEVVVNAAAVVNINLCEGNMENAYRVNARLCSIVAQLCEKSSAYFIQISTDHYYVGDGNAKHSEGASIQLVNEYARTKYLGECLALNNCGSVVLRTNIVGYRGVKFRPTFLEWIENSIKSEEKIFLYDDYYTSSIHVCQFARILNDIIRIRPAGIYNIAASQVTSKKEFVLKVANEVYGKEPNYAVASVARQTDAQRANSLGLSTAKAEALLGYKMPDLDKVVESIKIERLQMGI